jgi:hypothetical protein
MIDVSAAKAKADARHLTTLETGQSGPAGVQATRREPVLFSERQVMIVQQFLALVSSEQQNDYYAAVLAHLSGCPGIAAVDAACIEPGQGFIANEILAGFHRSRQRSGYRIPGGSKEVRGE